MYLQHFQLLQNPFSLTPSLNMYCDLPQHQAAINLLNYGLEQGECLMKITGDVGVGKTLLCRKLLDTLPETYVSCYIFNPCMSGEDILRAIGKDLGITLADDASRFALIQALSDQLLVQHEAGKKVVLLIDEAHLLTHESLELLRLLTNLETDSRKLLHIILVGQSELNERLQSKDMRQILQRIVYSYHIDSLPGEYTKPYLVRRLIAAGHQHGNLFSQAALRTLNRYGGGVPRILNILCNKAMLIACGRGSELVMQQDIKRAIKDSHLLIRSLRLRQRTTHMALKVCLGALLLLSATGCVILFQLG